MYIVALVVHSYLRWAVLLTGVWAFGRAAGRWGADAPWTAGDDLAGRLFITVFDLQLMVGLLLYIAFSSLAQLAFANMGAAMKDPILRFYAVEHITGMLVSLTAAHIGRARTRRVTDAPARHKTAALYYGLAMFVMLLTIPWPAMPYGRPLFRW
jgi:hypothetical protein